MKSILVPIDFSEVTVAVVDLAIQLAKAFGAEVHLLHVKELNPAPPVGTVGYGVMGMPELMPTGGLTTPVIEPVSSPTQDQKIKQWQSRFTEASIKVTVHEPIGIIVDEILTKAGDLHVELIVMGRHGHGAMYNLLVGSVTEGVLKHSTCPVLLVPTSRS